MPRWRHSLHPWSSSLELDVFIIYIRNEGKAAELTLVESLCKVAVLGFSPGETVG